MISNLTYQKFLNELLLMYEGLMLHYSNKCKLLEDKKKKYTKSWYICVDFLHQYEMAYKLSYMVFKSYVDSTFMDKCYSTLFNQSDFSNLKE